MTVADMTGDSSLKAALTQLADGQHDAAIQTLQGLPANAAAQVRLRELLIGENRLDDAVTIARRQASENTAEACVARSVLAFHRNDWQQALIECQAALDMEPSLATAHNHAGRALHNLGQGQQALGAFQRALQLDPEYVEAWHNLGHVQRAAGDAQRALKAYGKALELAPGFAAARHNLGVTLFNLDQVNAAREAFERVLRDQPDHLGALVDGGLTLQLMGRFDLARTQYERALQLAPRHAVAHLYLGRLLNELMDSETALGHLKTAVEIDPEDVEAWVELTGVYEQSNRLDAAIGALREGFRADPQHPGLHLEGARLERRQGDAAAAVRRLRALNVQQLPARLKQQYWFELGQCLDRDGDAEGALEAFSAGNELARQSVRSRQVDPDAFLRRCRDLETWLNAGAPGKDAGQESGRSPGAVPSADPESGKGLCFLVGFPRSGTTLVDTTLATHPRVDALEEAATLDFIVNDLATECGGYPAALGKLSPSGAAAYRLTVEKAVHQLLGRPPRDLLIDKMPLRFLHAGLIQRLYPQAKMVFVLRHPCDVVLSNFMQQYAVNETNIHFDSLANAAGVYARIMNLWELIEATIQPSVHYVRYEDLVSDLPRAIGGVAKYLGLDPALLSHDRDDRLATRARVTTSSYQQVGEPIYDRAVQRWTRYREHFQPLLPMLESAIRRYGYQR